MRKLFFFLLVLLTACQPPVPAALPTQSPAEIQTAAAKTVEVILHATATAQPTEPLQAEVTVTPIRIATSQPASQPAADFWVTYISLHRLWISRQDGSTPTLLTNTPASDFMPDWSPDGKYLAFLRFDAEDAFSGTLHVLEADSNTPIELTPTRQYNTFTWLPDSRSILAVEGDPREPESYIIEVMTGEARSLDAISGGQPNLSPDGKKIATLKTITNPCVGEGCVPPNDLFVYDIASEELTQLTNDGKPKEWLLWSPDGKSLSFHIVNTDSGFTELAAFDGSGVQAHQPAPWWADHYYAISPDGTQIAYAVQDAAARAYAVFVMPFGMENSGAVQIAKLTEETDGGDPLIDVLRWLPDGTGLVFNNWSFLYHARIDGSGFDRLPIEMEKTVFDLLPNPASYSPPPEPTKPSAWKLCPGGLESRLDVGERASVSTDPPSPNNVRNGTNKNNQLLGQIQPGEVVEILDGPVCEDGLIWWQIRSLSSGLKGWTLEGDRKTYWLVPED